MKIMELYENVQADKDLQGWLLGKGLQTKAVITHKPTGLTTHIPLGELDKLSWDTVRSVLVGEREPVALISMTRVIGYYSFIHNWNASKRGELNDRHRGNYSLPEAAAPIVHRAEPTPVVARVLEPVMLNEPEPALAV